jgi:replicative superfamily II helicase
LATLDRFLGKKEKESSLIETIESLFSIKVNDLQRRAIRVIEETNDNIIVSAPTGSGKTIVGYSALIKHGRGFYLAPLISLMMEKYVELSKVLGTKYKVMVSNRDYRVPSPKFLTADFKILSPYKFLVLFNEIKPKEHGDVIVVDEIHKMSHDPLFEASITLAKRKGFRIIGLSATLTERDINYLSRWLNARVIKSDVRPVKLHHTYIKTRFRGGVYVVDDDYVLNGKTLISSGDTFYSREEISAYLALRIHQLTGKSVIVWAPTRNKVEKIAKLIANMLAENPKYKEVALKLPASNPSERLLRWTSSRGVFIHHGGLSSTARDIVEKTYKKYGGIIVTAYTLSHGVNLPGSYLVFSTIFDWKGELVTPSIFHQISGRAGRPGYDDEGVVITVLVDDAEESYYNTVLARVKASEIIPELLSSPYNAVKMLLPVVNRVGISEGIETLKSSFSYLKNPDDNAIKEIMSVLEKVINYYKNIGGREAWVAMDMGLHPIEYEIIKTALENDYYSALPKIIELASLIHGKPPERVSYDITKYGYLAIWMGNPDSREIANTIQTILETGVYFSTRVYGWRSHEREHMSRIAKMFTFAGNTRVEPLSKEVRIDTLRRMIKAAPQIVEGASNVDEAVSATIVAVKEAFHFWKRVHPKTVTRLAKLVWYAITGNEEPPPELVKTVVEEVMKK